MKDHFSEKSKTWDEGTVQVQGAKTIADAIKNDIELSGSMEILDFGVGTGLLGFEIAKSVKKVYGIDTSASMLEKLHKKNTSELSIDTYCQDIIKEPLKNIFDGLVSSMTLHHVEDLKAFFETIHKNISSNGFIAIADLEVEDGTFHSDNMGVFHFGFDEENLVKIVEESGFKNVKYRNINTINKPNKKFGVFLLTAER
ncbi:class I SAM-dependent methyltransferase [Candidatus Sulfurimonas marisnigri]|uniref:Class I SAM-dependent methyltransferase n=1 Tax=Candidatus Sulfurimonas marisnigri TaxID=2740405 RepID=A0A7S7RRE1_9BACT|nr:class I SAM-dependent methyltransferase [Candidatus Sulfurimonas marisnigri]QOY55573.1 class I SAM-dependent methyltransferase [Candidatus Sulfurimonas marisnigri]